MCPAIRTWKIMCHGVKNLTTDRCGTHDRWTLAGLLIVTDIGTGSARGAGLGWITSRGGSRPITMDAGRLSAVRGAGALARSMRVRSTGQLSLDLWAENILVSDSALAGAGAAE